MPEPPWKTGDAGAGAANAVAGQAYEDNPVVRDIDEFDIAPVGLDVWPNLLQDLERV